MAAVEATNREILPGQVVSWCYELTKYLGICIHVSNVPHHCRRVFGEVCFVRPRWFPMTYSYHRPIRNFDWWCPLSCRKSFEDIGSKSSYTNSLFAHLNISVEARVLLQIFGATTKDKNLGKISVSPASFV